MPVDLHSARRFEELLDAPDEQGPYVHASIFARETRRQRRLSKKKFKLLQRIDEDLREMLAEGERVLFLTQGSTVGFWETYFVGFVMYYVNRRAIVLTNRRILLLQITARGYPRELRGEIDYRAIHDVERTLFGHTRLLFRNEATRVVSGVPRSDRQFLHDRIEQLQDSMDVDWLTHEDVWDLCPHCFARASIGDPECGTCGGRFKSPRHAALLSLVFPGAGDFYLGHRGFAAAEVLTAGLVWAGIVSLAWDPTVAPIAFALVLLFFALVMHGVDALGTRYIARKGLYPVEASGGAARRYALAALVPVVFIGVSIVPLAAKRGLAPLAGVVAGHAMPDRHVEALVDAGYLAAGETVLWFHSQGLFSILEAGTVLSDRRVVIYGHDGTAPFVADASYPDIVDVQREVPPDAEGVSVMVVLREDGQGFWFVLPSADEQDRVLQQALMERWRIARASRGEGIWYDGGTGTSAEEPVVVRGLSPGEDGVEAERRWLDLWLGPENTEWRWTERTRGSLDNRAIDRVEVTTRVEGPRTYFFDVGGARVGEPR